MEKYQRFFQEFKDFVILKKWSKKEWLIGLAEHEIIECEEDYDINLGHCIRAYWSVFGNKILIPIMKLDYTYERMSSTYENITEYREDYPEFNFEEEIKKEFEKEGFEKQSGKVILIDSLLEHDMLYFTFPNQTDFIIHSCSFTYNGESIFKINSDFVSIIGLIRSLIRRGLFLKYADPIRFPHKEKYEPLFIDDLEPPWMNYYKNYNIGLDQRLIEENKEYAKSVIEKENKAQTILGIDAYEVGFIKFLIEKKGFPLDKKIFDPYEFKMTFYDYLK